MSQSENLLCKTAVTITLLFSPFILHPDIYSLSIAYMAMVPSTSILWCFLGVIRSGDPFKSLSYTSKVDTKHRSRRAGTALIRFCHPHCQYRSARLQILQIAGNLLPKPYYTLISLRTQLPLQCQYCVRMPSDKYCNHFKRAKELFQVPIRNALHKYR